MKVSLSSDQVPTETDFLKIEHPEFGTFYISESQSAYEPGLQIISERSLEIFPRMDNSIRVFSKPPKKTKGNAGKLESGEAEP